MLGLNFPLPASTPAVDPSDLTDQLRDAFTNKFLQQRGIPLGQSPLMPVTVPTPFGSTVTIPSVADQWSSALKAAETHAPNPNDALIADAQAKIAAANTLRHAYDSYPTTQFTPYTPPPAVQRQNAEMPNRVAPRTDPVAGLGALLASFIDPVHAGQFGAAPLQASQAVADRDTKDALARFQYEQELNNQRYNDANQMRSQQMQIDQNNLAGSDKAANQNALSQFNAQLNQAIQDADISGNTAKLQQLNQMKDAFNTYLSNKADADVLGRRMTDMLGQNKSIMDANNELQKNQVGLVRNLYDLESNANIAQDRQAEAERHNREMEANRKLGIDNAFKIGQARVDVANKNADTRIEALKQKFNPGGKMAPVTAAVQGVSKARQEAQIAQQRYTDALARNFGRIDPVSRKAFEDTIANANKNLQDALAYQSSVSQSSPAGNVPYNPLQSGNTILSAAPLGGTAQSLFEKYGKKK